MQTRLMNMVMICDEVNDKVLVLDKSKSMAGGLLFLRQGRGRESLTDSVIREAKEETNLDIENPVLVGLITWIVEGRRDMGFLFRTRDFKGELIENNREGRLFWDSYEHMKDSKELSESMDKIFEIYEGKFQEITWFYDEGRVIYQ